MIGVLAPQPPCSKPGLGTTFVVCGAATRAMRPAPASANAREKPASALWLFLAARRFRKAPRPLESGMVDRALRNGSATESGTSKGGCTLSFACATGAAGDTREPRASSTKVPATASTISAPPSSAILVLMVVPPACERASEADRRLGEQVALPTSAGCLGSGRDEQHGVRRKSRDRRRTASVDLDVPNHCQG